MSIYGAAKSLTLNCAQSIAVTHRRISGCEWMGHMIVAIIIIINRAEYTVRAVINRLVYQFSRQMWSEYGCDVTTCASFLHPVCATICLSRRVKWEFTLKIGNAGHQHLSIWFRWNSIGLYSSLISHQRQVDKYMQWAVECSILVRSTMPQSY